MEAISAALRRFGGVLLAPRRAVAAAAPDVGQADGWILGSVYLVAVGTYPIMEGIAGVLATRDLTALIMLASTLGRLLIAPILVLVAAETMLGAGRGHRRALALVPLLVVAVVGQQLVALGGAMPAFTVPLVGGLAGLALTLWFRPAVPREPDGVAAERPSKGAGA